MCSTSCCAVAARHRSVCEAHAMTRRITTTQTIGPFFHEGLRWAFDATNSAGELVIDGQVLDGDGAPVSDAMLEAWRPGADGDGIGALPGLTRVPTGERGEFRLALPARGSGGAPAAFITLF